MTTIWWILGVLAANMVLGAAVWASIDDEQQQLLAWFKECPPPFSILVQPMVLSAWPVGLWFWVRGTR